MMRVQHTLLALILLFAFSLQIGSKCIIWANYLLNKKSITIQFCVNKSKPKMNCNGKCHLKKQLKEQDKKEQSPSTSLKEVKEIQLYHQAQSFIEVVSENNILLSPSDFQYTFHISTEHLKLVFHPPLAA
jgi:hypothetical protein